MTIKDRFPQSLLSQSSTARLTYFQNKVVAHPLLKQTHRALLDAIRQPAGASLIFVVGPTGVGKTTLRLRLERQLLEEEQVTMEQDPGYLPVAGLEVAAPEAGNFRWKDYYQRALIALDEPLIEHKLDYSVNNLRRDGNGNLLFGKQVIVSELRWALEQALRHRRLLAFIVDEAQHFSKIAGGRRLLDQMDTLKSLANLTNTVHVLVGTYEVLRLVNLSAQLNRRSIEIHFPRYHLDNPEERTAFRSILLTFQRHLPLRQEPDLVGWEEYYYEHSVGCVGVLKNWLTRALAAALEDGQKTLTHTLLERCALPPRRLLRLARELKDGEASLLESGATSTELRILLGLPSEASTARQGRPSQQVGQRRPIRDPVGRETHGN